MSELTLLAGLEILMHKEFGGTHNYLEKALYTYTEDRESLGNSEKLWK